MDDIFDFLLDSKNANRRKSWFDEDAESFYVSWEVPGFDKEDFDISYQDMVLTVKGETNFRGVQKSFKQSLSVPKAIDPDGIQAHLERGILTISLRKTESQKPRQIPIR